MSDGIGAQRPRETASPHAPVDSRQYVQFIFYKVDPAWRRLPTDEREGSKREAAAAIQALADRMQVRSYTLVGIRGDADFMLWHISDDVRPFQEAAMRLTSTSLGPYLSTPYAYLSMTRKSVYVDKTESEASSARRLTLSPGNAKYLFVYPFVKTRQWYNLSAEQRQAMMDTHIRIGRKYPTVKLNTTYSFGLDDQEFVVAFETDAPGDFLDLVMELRETESSLYTLRDTPTFTCVATNVRGALDALDGAHTSTAPVDDALRAASGQISVCRLEELPQGASKAVYVAGEQVALFNVAGEIYAIEARCPHASASLIDEGKVDGTSLTCSRHGSAFDLAHECAVSRGPASRSPRIWDVRIDDGQVFVSPRRASVEPANA